MFGFLKISNISTSFFIGGLASAKHRGSGCCSLIETSVFLVKVNEKLGFLAQFGAFGGSP